MGKRNNRSTRKGNPPGGVPPTPPPVVPPPAPPPQPRPEPDPPKKVYTINENTASSPSRVQRAANELAAALYEAGVDPVTRRSKEMIDNQLTPRQSIAEVEARLLIYFTTSFDSASLKPTEAAALGRSFATVAIARRKLELAEKEDKRLEAEEERKRTAEPTIQELRRLQAERLAKELGKGGYFPGRNKDPQELSPEDKGPPTGDFDGDQQPDDPIDPMPDD